MSGVRIQATGAADPDPGDVQRTVSALERAANGLLRNLHADSGTPDPTALAVLALEDARRAVEAAQRDAEARIEEAERTARQRVADARSQIEAELRPHFEQAEAGIDEWRGRRRALAERLRQLDTALGTFTDEVGTTASLVSSLIEAPNPDSTSAEATEAGPTDDAPTDDAEPTEVIELPEFR